MEKSKNRQPAVELLRLIGCILVIMAHAQIYPIVEEKMVGGRLLLSTIIADDVPIFFLITGFFFFGRVLSDNDVLSAYIYKIKTFFINIWIPSVIFQIIYCAYGVKRFGQDWSALWGFLFRQSPGNHLWFVSAYLQFVILFPLLAYICRDEKNRNIIRRIVLLISIAGSLIVDIEYALGKAMMDKDTQFGLSYYLIFLLLGYELSVIIPKMKERIPYTALIGAAIYVSGVIVKYALQMSMFNKFNVYENRFRWLQCTPCFFTAAGIFIFIYSFNDSLVKHRGASGIIDFLGSKMFYVFLAHQLVIYETMGLRDKILELNKGGMVLGYVLLYYIEYVAVVFAISLAVAFVCEMIYNYAVRQWLYKLFLKNKRVRVQDGDEEQEEN